MAIIGAGAAGLAAARRVIGAGRRALLIEATGRIGGRAWTATVDGMALDLGCGWLHSGDRNPLTRRAEQGGFTVDRSPSAWQHQFRDLGFTPAEQRAAAAYQSAFQRRLSEAPPPSDRAADALEPGSEWNAYAEAVSGYLNGAGLGALSIADYLAYDRAASDVNWRVREGYGTLLAAELPPAALMLGSPVERIELAPDGIDIASARATVRARTAIVTVSTNVLAAGDLRLPREADAHVAAAADVPLGLADKLFIAAEPALGLKPETHLVGNPHRADTGSYYLRPFGLPVIEAFFGGVGAARLEGRGPADAFGFAIDELTALLGSDARRHLRPLIGSSWCRETYVRGSYSHALPGKAGARAILAQPVAGRLFFAGEATHPTDFSTAHGAWESGERAAGEALAALDQVR